MKAVCLAELKWFEWGEWSFELLSFDWPTEWGALLWIAYDGGVWTFDAFYVRTVVRQWREYRERRRGGGLPG